MPAEPPPARYTAGRLARSQAGEDVFRRRVKRRARSRHEKRKGQAFIMVEPDWMK